MKEQLIEDFDDLGIVDTEAVTVLHKGGGKLVNLDFPLAGDQAVSLRDNKKTYYINQLEKKGRLKFVYER